MVGLKLTSMAARFCSSGLVRYLARSTAALVFFEYLFTAQFQPPSVPVFLPSGPPFGRALTPTFPFVGLSGAVLLIHEPASLIAAPPFGFLMVTLPLPSTMVPPPKLSTHSSPLQVSPSYARPWKTMPHILSLPALRSPSCTIFADSVRSCQVVGG